MKGDKAGVVNSGDIAARIRWACGQRVLQLTDDEAEPSRSQTVTSKAGRGQHRKCHPLAFTEHGCLMLSNFLRSARATEVSVLSMRAFVRRCCRPVLERSPRCRRTELPRGDATNRYDATRKGLRRTPGR